MRIFFIIAGLTKFAPSVLVEPDDTVATLFERLEKKLRDVRKPSKFIAAYSLMHGRESGLGFKDPDLIALRNGDPVVMAQYLTPAARLDPTKTVGYYFGDHVAEPRKVLIALTWPHDSHARIQLLRKLAYENACPLPAERLRRERIATTSYIPREFMDGSFTSSLSTPLMIEACCEVLVAPLSVSKSLWEVCTKAVCDWLEIRTKTAQAKKHD